MTRNIRVFAHTRISVAAHATSIAAIAVNQQKTTLPLAHINCRFAEEKGAVWTGF